MRCNLIRRLNMYARNISFRLKSNMQSDYTRTFENQILPLLRKQKGFKDEITLSNPGSQDAVSISLWEHKNNADDYNTNAYPEVLKTLAKVIDGTPRVHPQLAHAKHSLQPACHRVGQCLAHHRRFAHLRKTLGWVRRLAIARDRPI